jgi:hypothetical protein
MFNGPLSERIDSILEKPLIDEPKKPKKVKTKKKLLSDAGSQDGAKIEDWEATQVNCPIPTRSPDQWVH